jgi:hypothetical protein
MYETVSPILYYIKIAYQNQFHYLFHLFVHSTNMYFLGTVLNTAVTLKTSTCPYGACIQVEIR